MDCIFIIIVRAKMSIRVGKVEHHGTKQKTNILKGVFPTFPVQGRQKNQHGYMAGLAGRRRERLLVKFEIEAKFTTRQCKLVEAT
jgi:hypothetical protein